MSISAFTISEVADEWHELMILQHTMHTSIVITATHRDRRLS